jgi:hypothetical protein
MITATTYWRRFAAAIRGRPIDGPTWRTVVTTAAAAGLGGVLVLGTRPPAPAPSLLAAAPATRTPDRWQHTAAAGATARHADCPALPAGCFAVAPDCVVSWCYCPAACAAAGQAHADGSRIWRPGSTADCHCGDG